jgi:hypothetical protein
MMKNIFDAKIANELIARINTLNPDTSALWGKMTVDQMLAHSIVAYDMAYTDKYPKPNALMRLMFKTFVKNGVVNETPYPKNSRTAPAFIISDRRNFEKEKARLIGYLAQTRDLGASHFEGKESLSFGPMSAGEWNNLFYKHLDHHLNQFGV